MEIFRELDRLDREIRRRSPPLDQWRRFVYCATIAGLPTRGQQQTGQFGSLLGAVEHFFMAQKETTVPTRSAIFPNMTFCDYSVIKL